MIKIAHTVRHAGTADAEVRFRLTASQLQIVRRHYKQPDGVLRFGGRAEVYCQGNGHYVAWCVNDVIDGAQRAIVQIEAALRLNAEALMAERIIEPVPPVIAAVLCDNRLRRRYLLPRTPGGRYSFNNPWNRNAQFSSPPQPIHVTRSH